MSRAFRILTILLISAGSAGRASAQCVCDCNGDRSVMVDEVVLAVSVAAGGTIPCSAIEPNQDGRVTSDEILIGVRNLLAGCGGVSIPDLQVPEDFDYATSGAVEIDVAVCTPNTSPYPGAGVMVFSPDWATEGPSTLLWRGIADVHGRVRARIHVASRFTHLRLVASALGAVNDVIVPVLDGRAVHDFCRASAQPRSAVLR